MQRVELLEGDLVAGRVYRCEENPAVSVSAGSGGESRGALVNNGDRASPALHPLVVGIAADLIDRLSVPEFDVGR